MLLASFHAVVECFSTDPQVSIVYCLFYLFEAEMSNVHIISAAYLKILYTQLDTEQRSRQL